MFDQEKSIAKWRRQMAAAIKTPVLLDELENHLREDIDRQVRSGTDLPQAFDAAVRRMGDARALKTEFAKVGAVMSPRQRTANFVVCAIAAILYGLFGGAFLFNLFGHPLVFRERMLGVGACVLVAVILLSWRFSYRFLPVLPTKRMRLAAALLGCLLSGLCTAMLLRFFLANASTEVAVAIAVLWAILPGAIAASLIFGLEEAAYRKKCGA
jgi:hypothetical protein